MKKCKIRDCDGKSYCRGWCKKHYTRWERYGSPDIVHERYRFTKEDKAKALASCKTYRAEDDSLYFIWGGIKARCGRKTHKDYPRYGGRGIQVCSRWLGKDGYKHFCEDMGPRPDKTYSIDRINNSLGYSPENCRWATPKEQVLNQRNTVWVEYEGEKFCLFDLAKKLKISNSTLWWRYSKGREIYPGVKLLSERSF